MTTVLESTTVLVPHSVQEAATDLVMAAHDADQDAGRVAARMSRAQLEEVAELLARCVSPDAPLLHQGNVHRFRTAREKLQTVITAVLRHFDREVTPAEVLGRTRRPEAMAARQVAMTVMHRHVGMSSPTVGGLFGRDHSTVLHAVRRCDTDPDFDAQVHAAVRLLHEWGCLP